MRSRAPALVAVVAFAVAVAAVAVLAGGGGGGQKLVKLPLSSAGGASADAASGTAEARSSLAFAGPVEYRFEGKLPDLPGTAPAYRLGSVATTAAVGRLATALGLDGDVKADSDGWLVRSGDRELRVSKLPGLAWYLGPACPEAPVGSDGQTISCAGIVSVGTPIDLGGSGSSGSSVGACPPERCVVSDPIEAFDQPCPAGAACSTQPTAPVCAASATVRCAAPHPAPAPACDPNAVCTAPAPAAACKDGTVECIPSSPPSCPPGVACIAGPTCPPDAGCVEPAPIPLPEPAQPVPAPEKPVRPADLPSEADARAVAREAFARLGAGADGFVMEDGWLTWEARVDTRIGGLPVIGLGTAVSIGPKGQLVRGNGFLAAPEKIGDYPLVGAEAGLRRLTSGFGGSFGGGGGPQPLVAAENGAFTKGAIEPAMPECAMPAVSCVAPPVPAPMVQVLTGVHLALLQTGDVLVPAYEFELKDGGTVAVPAVTDEWLDRQAPVAKVED